MSKRQPSSDRSTDCIEDSSSVSCPKDVEMLAQKHDRGFVLLSNPPNYTLIKTTNVESPERNTCNAVVLHCDQSVQPYDDDGKYQSKVEKYWRQYAMENESDLRDDTANDENS